MRAPRFLRCGATAAAHCVPFASIVPTLAAIALGFAAAGCGKDEQFAPAPGGGNAATPAAPGTAKAGDPKAGAANGGAADPFAAPLGVESAKLIVPEDNPLTPAKVELGKTLFFDPRLSASGSMSCSTCHLPDRGWTDQQKLSKKDDGSMNVRNTPTMRNVGYLEWLYWDGRANTLEKNIDAAWKNQMSGKPDEVAKKLAAIPAYVERFQQAMGGPPTPDAIVKALASFLRTLRSGDSPFDRWQAGDDGAVSADVKAGYDFFVGKAGCSVCHLAPLFTDRGLHVTGIGMKAEKPDLGAGAKNVRNDPLMHGAFKTPSLRDLADTEPYFHDGSAATLEEAVDVMLAGGVDVANKDRSLTKRDLTADERRQLLAFLASLRSNAPKFTAPDVPK